MTSVGIDLGGDELTAVTVDARGAIRARATRPNAPADIGASLPSLIREMRAGSPTGIVGVALPQGHDAPSPQVSALIADEAGAPAVVSSGQALALAEAWCGAAKGAQHVVSFAIGEHVSAGIIIAGQLLRGASGHAGSVAFLALNPVEREDYRRHGSLEAEVAAAGIVRRLIWRIKSGDRSDAAARVEGDLSRLTAADVFAAARDGDGVCESVVRDTAKYVGMAIANLVSILDPECVVLSGTLASSGDLMFDAIRAECSRRLRPMQSAQVQIVLGTLGTDAAAIGAARASMLPTQ